MAFDGSSLWVARSASSRINVLRAAGGTLVKTVRARARPSAIGFDGTNIWVMNDDHTIGKR